MRKKHQGFTMIEMIVVLLIIGILARIAFTSYLSQVQKGNRSDAKVALNEVAQRMQRCFTSQSTYKPATTGVCTVVDNVSGAVAETGTGASGVTSPQKYYLVTTSVLTASTYTLDATPIAGKPQVKDTNCAVISLDQTGKKTAKNTAGDDTTDKCW